MEKRVNSQRNADGINQHSEREVICQSDKKPQSSESVTNTGERLGKDYRVSPTTIVRYGAYATALDAIAKAAPDFHTKIMTGELKVTQDSVVNIGRLVPSEIRSVGEELTENPTAYFAYTDERGEMRKNTPNKVQLELMNVGAIKKIPEYDPDAEIQSLAFTIPSWVSSISRVRTTARFSEISDKAREKIKVALDELSVAVETIRNAIQEDR